MGVDSKRLILRSQTLHSINSLPWYNAGVLWALAGATVNQISAGLSA